MCQKRPGIIKLADGTVIFARSITKDNKKLHIENARTVMNNGNDTIYGVIDEASVHLDAVEVYFCILRGGKEG